MIGIEGRIGHVYHRANQRTLRLSSARMLPEYVRTLVLRVDLRMPKKDGLQVVDELMSGRPPKPRIIVITTYEDEEDIRRAVKAGARGYLVKTADYEDIEEAVRAVAAGRSLFPAAITLKLLEAVARPEPSQCELEVLHFIASGRSNKEIGNVLYISEFTVKGHVRSILEKARGEGPF